MIKKNYEKKLVAAMLNDQSGVAINGITSSQLRASSHSYIRNLLQNDN